MSFSPSLFSRTDFWKHVDFNGIPEASYPPPLHPLKLPPPPHCYGSPATLCYRSQSDSTHYAPKTAARLRCEKLRIVIPVNRYVHPQSIPPAVCPCGGDCNLHNWGEADREAAFEWPSPSLSLVPSDYSPKSPEEETAFFHSPKPWFDSCFDTPIAKERTLVAPPPAPRKLYAFSQITPTKRRRLFF